MEAFLIYDQQKAKLLPNRMSFFESLYIDFKVTDLPYGRRFQLHIHPKRDVDLQGLRISLLHNYSSDDRIFCNGWQSSSESREYGYEEKIPPLNWVGKLVYPFEGDRHISVVNQNPGHLHSWTYSYIRRHDKVTFVGSLDESSGFTIVHHNVKMDAFVIRKDWENLTISHSYPALDVLLCYGEITEVFGHFFSLMEKQPLRARPMITWLFNANHAPSNIPDNIKLGLQAFETNGIPIDYVLLDEGYQKKVGDWLHLRKGFSSNISKLSHEVHQMGKGMALWLAPFVCQKDSELYRNHPDWLLKDVRGKNIKAGPYFALDFYNGQLQEYLTGLFYTITQKWKIDLIYLDWLYAACIQSRPKLQRGRIMQEAMLFLRNLAGKKLLMGSRVPLGAAFGTLDYCRVGTDTLKGWDDRLLKWQGNRERPSTLLALRSVLSRWQLNGSSWWSSPGVIGLSKSNRLTHQQQYSLLLISTLLGGALVIEPDIHDFSVEQWAELQNVAKWRNSSINEVRDLGNDRFVIRFLYEDQEYIANCNLNDKPGIFDNGKMRIELKAYETLITKK